MTKWYNFAVKLSDLDKKDKIMGELENLELKIYSDKDNVIKFTENSRNISKNVITSLVTKHNDCISQFVSVEANDTSDTAYGTLYNVSENGLEKERSDSSRGESSRRDWIGIGGVDGGKYY